jgi:hypothetical protein
MQDKYYRITPKAHPEQGGSFIRQSGDSLEVVAGNISLNGFSISSGQLVSSNKSLLIREATKSQAKKAESDYTYLDMMTPFGGPAVRSVGGKVFVGGLH